MCLICVNGITGKQKTKGNIDCYGCSIISPSMLVFQRTFTSAVKIFNRYLLDKVLRDLCYIVMTKAYAAIPRFSFRVSGSGSVSGSCSAYIEAKMFELTLTLSF